MALDVLARYAQGWFPVRQANPAKSPKAFQEPKTLPVLPAKIPRERKLGINKCAVWKTKTMAEDNITPSRTTFALSLVLKTMEDINIRIKPEKINQKLPTSNIVPNKDTCEFAEKTEESRKERTTPNPETNNQDLGPRKSRRRQAPQLEATLWRFQLEF